MKTVTKMPFPVYEALHSNKIPNYLPKTTRWTRPPKPEKQQQQKTTPIYAKQVQTRKPMIRTKAPQTTTTAVYRKKQKPTKPTRTYDQNQHEKLNTILLAYKSSRADNEDIVDTWLQSLMSDLTTKAAEITTRRKAVVTRPVMILK